MSWDGYVTSLESGKGRCKYAALYGRQGGCWAESSRAKSNFPVSPDEVANVTRAITAQDMNIMGTGITMGGTKFTCLRLEPDLLICQGKGDNKEFSLVIALTNQAVIIGFNPEAETKTACVRNDIEVMRDYLKQAGY